MEKLWSGRFGERVAAVVDRLNASLYFDWRLAPYDLWQNRVWAEELHRIGILDDRDHAALGEAFAAVETELKEGRFPFRLELEDVHMNLEARLTELAGEAGRRIHTGRSRNDQVATVARLWLRDAASVLAEALRALVVTTLELAERHAELLVPGYTHLQRAQVVTFGHVLHAYAEMLLRDLEALEGVFRELDRCPLGSGALAGSPYPIDRERVARALGFGAPTRNSLDAVADRDWALAFLAWATRVGVHLSRWAEEVILWASSEFGWIRLPDAFATGSSMMPQKKNPDVAELARGKAGRLLGDHVSLATVLKGLPLAYNKDLQEDKEPLFDAFATLRLILAAWTPMLAALEVVPERMRAALDRGHLLATDLADALVRLKGVPFREAHAIVGRAVAAAEAKGVDLAALSAEELAAVDPRLDAEIAALCSLERSLAERSLIGGPAPAALRRNVAAAREALAALPSHEPRIPWALELEPPASWAW